LPSDRQNGWLSEPAAREPRELSSMRAVLLKERTARGGGRKAFLEQTCKSGGSGLAAGKHLISPEEGNGAKRGHQRRRPGGGGPEPRGRTREKRDIGKRRLRPPGNNAGVSEALPRGKDIIHPGAGRNETKEEAGQSIQHLSAKKKRRTGCPGRRNRKVQKTPLRRRLLQTQHREKPGGRPKKKRRRSENLATMEHAGEEKVENDPETPRRQRSSIEP